MSTHTRQIAHRHPSTGIAATSAHALALVTMLGACVDQPKPHCIATTNAFAVKLIELQRAESAAGACMGFGPDGFNADPEVGLSPYFQRAGDGQPDYDRGSLAVQTAELGSFFYTAEGLGVANAAPDGQIYSLGDFATAEPDDDNFCTVPTLSPTRLVLPEIAAVSDDPATADVDESVPGQAAVDAALDWSNVRVYVTAETYGTQMDGEVLDTRVTPTGDSCAITYRAVGLSPAIPCAALDPDGAPLLNADGSFQLDPAACEPEANLAEGRPTGSGISASARYECNPVTAFCMIEGETIPALR
jgi:hypothetical protein